MTEDIDRRSRFALPLGTIALVAIMFYAFAMERRARDWGILNTIIDDLGFSWIAFQAHPLANIPRLLSHSFLHANESHIIGNVIFFVLFAPAVEREMGHFMFLFLYLVWAAVSACTQGYFEPYSNGLIGASGAISGALGAYFVLFPLRTPRSFLTRYMGRFIAGIPAFFWVGLWFLAQLKGGFRLILPEMAPGETTNVAYWAHVGGFAVGALSAWPFVWIKPQPKADASLPN